MGEGLTTPTAAAHLRAKNACAPEQKYSQQERQRYPERGLVFPSEFIDYAEQEGLVVELGNWVVRETCRQIAAWLAQGIDVVPVAINVSPYAGRQCTD